MPALAQEGVNCQEGRCCDLPGHGSSTRWQSSTGNYISHFCFSTYFQQIAISPTDTSKLLLFQKLLTYLFPCVISIYSMHSNRDSSQLWPNSPHLSYVCVPSTQLSAAAVHLHSTISEQSTI